MATHPSATIVVGNVAECTVTFLDEAEAPADPSTIVGTTLAPDGITVETFTYGVDAELTRVEQGIYRLKFPLTVVGHWAVRLVGSGSVVAAAEAHIEVPISPFPVP